MRKSLSLLLWSSLSSGQHKKANKEARYSCTQGLSGICRSVDPRSCPQIILGEAVLRLKTEWEFAKQTEELGARRHKGISGRGDISGGRGHSPSRTCKYGLITVPDRVCLGEGQGTGQRGGWARSQKGLNMAALKGFCHIS